MIETCDLSKQYNNDFWAVDGVTLSVQPGQILALLGQNGAGKTTTVRMLTALLAPTRGWARVGGFDVTKNPQEVRAQVGVLTEQHGLYMRMTAVEYLEFFGRIYGLDSAVRKSRTSHLLGYFGLEAAAHRRLGEYSKGMKQKLAVARTLLHRPALVFMDEPTAGLDPVLTEQIGTVIADLKKLRITAIVVTHDLNLAAAVADRLGMIHEGRLIEAGTPAQVWATANPVVRAFLNTQMKIPGR